MLVGDELGGAGTERNKARASGEWSSAMDGERHRWRERAEPTPEAHRQRGAKIGWIAHDGLDPIGCRGAARGGGEHRVNDVVRIPHARWGIRESYI
jgi:hypothetical protein